MSYCIEHNILTKLENGLELACCIQFFCMKMNVAITYKKKILTPSQLSLHLSQQGNHGNAASGRPQLEIQSSEGAQLEL